MHTLKPTMYLSTRWADLTGRRERRGWFRLEALTWRRLDGQYYAIAPLLEAP